MWKEIFDVAGYYRYYNHDPSIPVYFGTWECKCRECGKITQGPRNWPGSGGVQFHYNECKINKRKENAQN